MIEYILVMSINGVLSYAADKRTDQMLIFESLEKCQKVQVVMEQVAVRVMKENPQFDKKLTPVIDCVDRAKSPFAADEEDEKQFFDFGNKKQES